MTGAVLLLMIVSSAIARPFTPDATGTLRFIWLTDSHNLTSSQPTRDGGVDGALADATTYGADAVIHTGDIGNDTPANVAAAFARLRGTAIPCPLITVIGNHDEYEATPGEPNTVQLEGASYFNRAAPFVYSTTVAAGNGNLVARVLCLDCNIYDENPADPETVSANHEPGDRIGAPAGGGGPTGGGWRKFDQDQLDWFAAQLAADTTSQIVLILSHYPPSGIGPTNYAAIADRIQADGRPAAMFYGHQHQSAFTSSISSTDGKRVIRAYKCPATQESGSWTRVQLRMRAGVVAFDELEVNNFTDPGGWTISAPFTLAT